MTTIKLPCYEIVVELTGDGKGSIISNLQEYPDSTNNVDANELESIRDYNERMNGLESLILGHACAGIDIETPAYLEGIESAVEGCANNE